MSKTKIKGAKKILKKELKSNGYASALRGHKTYTMLKVLASRGEDQNFSFNQLNRLATNYSYPYRKFDRVEDRGYVCATLKNYLSLGYLKRIVRGRYVVTDLGRNKLRTFETKFTKR